jgi:5-methyltetrahydrofolate--homocysteine methyltransferase
VSRLLEAEERKAREVHEVVEALEHRAVAEGLRRADGIYQWFRARGAGDDLLILDGSGREMARFTFPRRPAGERLCLAARRGRGRPTADARAR